MATELEQQTQEAVQALMAAEKELSARRELLEECDDEVSMLKFQVEQLEQKVRKSEALKIAHQEDLSNIKDVEIGGGKIPTPEEYQALAAEQGKVDDMKADLKAAIAGEEEKAQELQALLDQRKYSYSVALEDQSRASQAVPHAEAKVEGAQEVIRKTAVKVSKAKDSASAKLLEKQEEVSKKRRQAFKTYSVLVNGEKAISRIQTDLDELNEELTKTKKTLAEKIDILEGTSEYKSIKFDIEHEKAEPAALTAYIEAETAEYQKDVERISTQLNKLDAAMIFAKAKQEEDKVENQKAVKALRGAEASLSESQAKATEAETDFELVAATFEDFSQFSDKVVKEFEACLDDLQLYGEEVSKDRQAAVTELHDNLQTALNTFNDSKHTVQDLVQFQEKSSELLKGAKDNKLFTEQIDSKLDYVINFITEWVKKHVKAVFTEKTYVGTKAEYKDMLSKLKTTTDKVMGSDFVVVDNENKDSAEAGADHNADEDPNPSSPSMGG